jgi:uncharacterized protein YecE (DUF72 family)
MANWYLGTMGFSFKDWSGPFYPESLESRNYLEYYSQYFNAVEIDSTFYGAPRKEYVHRWVAVTPDDFIICAKTPRSITHEAGLVGVQQEMDAFLETMRLFGKKLGVILIQFPPSFAINKEPELAAFIKNLPQDMRFAVEVRHKSWYTERTGELLARHDVAWTTSIYEDLPEQIYIHNGTLYIRFIGRHGVYPTNDREYVDPTESLKWWAGQIQSRMDEIEDVYGFFNNDYAGFSPATCNRFKEIVGLPVVPIDPPKQGRLFDEQDLG